MKIHVRYIQNKGFVRYLLQREDGRFWTPQGTWKRGQRQAMLWAHIADAHKAYFALTDRFDVFVNGKLDFTTEELREWLMTHVKLTVTSEEGPVDGNRCQVYARFSTLTEKIHKRRGAV
jgi:hypothetical protein